jgi:hypothetical protein
MVRCGGARGSSWDNIVSTISSGHASDDSVGRGEGEMSMSKRSFRFARDLLRMDNATLLPQAVR